jgi:hypothetical protein
MVTVPVIGEVYETPEEAGRLPGFLRVLTGDLTAGQIYTIVEERRQLSDHDERMDGLASDPADFEPIWTALLAGIRPPEAAWEPVVLPVVVAFSDDKNVKTNLELATSFWMAATQPHAVESNVDDLHDDPAGLGELEAVEAVPAEIVSSGSRPDPAPAHRGRAVALTVALLLLAAAVALLWMQGVPASHPSRLDNGAAPAGPPSAESPTTAPSSAPSAEPGAGAPTVGSGVPAPAPSWAGPGPATAPGAPTGLVVLHATTTTIAVGWQAPADAGSGGIAYYRISLDGQDYGWTTKTSATMNGLSPATGYTITVTAYSAAGLASPPSGPITVSTAVFPTPSRHTPTPTPTPKPKPAGLRPPVDAHVGRVLVYA